MIEAGSTRPMPNMVSASSLGHNTPAHVLRVPGGPVNSTVNVPCVDVPPPRACIGTHVFAIEQNRMKGLCQNIETIAARWYSRLACSVRLGDGYRCCTSSGTSLLSQLLFGLASCHWMQPQLAVLLLQRGPFKNTPGTVPGP